MNEQSSSDCSAEQGCYYLTNVSIRHTEEDFNLTLTSHNSSRSYMTSPKHAKRIMLMLQAKVAEYEKKHGKLETSLPRAKKGDLHPNGQRLGFKINLERTSTIHASKKNTVKS